MKSSTYVYACIDKIMKSASSVPWNAYIKNSKGEWEEAHDHPLENLIQQPNPFMSRKQLIERVASHLYLGGNSILQKIKVRGEVKELWMLNPDDIKPVPSKTDFIGSYEYKKNGNTKSFKVDEIVHFMFPDPANPYWGFSPLQAGARTVDTDIEAVKWNKVALQNRAVSDGVFSFDEVMSQEQYDETKEMVRDQHQGSDNARAPWVLGAGAKWHPMSMSPVEMDFLNSRKMTREEICSIFQVPPPMIGIYENATLANIETARKILWVDTIIPFLDGIQEVLNRDLASEYDDGVWIGYDISNVQALQENFGEKITNAKELFNMGVPFNEVNARLELGFDAMEGGDVGYLPMNLVAVDGKTPKADDNKSMEVKFFNLDTQEEKAIHWKRLDDRRIKWEEQVTKLIAKRFKIESKAVVNAFKSKGIDETYKAIDKGIKDWEKLFKAFYISVMEDFGDEAVSSLAKSGNMVLEKKFDAYDEGVLNWIDNSVGDNIKHITKTTKDKIKEEVVKGYAVGEDSQDIAERLLGLYKDMSEARALTIARTEVGGAMNAGSHFAIEQTGLKYERVWLASQDDRVRETHAEISGQTVAEDEPFNVNGSKMMFPGDTSMGADAGEIIKCRCVETYEVRRD